MENNITFAGGVTLSESGRSVIYMDIRIDHVTDDMIKIFDPFISQLYEKFRSEEVEWFGESFLNKREPETNKYQNTVKLECYRATTTILIEMLEIIDKIRNNISAIRSSIPGS